MLAKDVGTMRENVAMNSYRILKLLPPAISPKFAIEFPGLSIERQWYICMIQLETLA